ncbi:hypothetical protein [Vreelandella glaciei]|uniref:hypothetical protein n=1 Tax=Vreelandella glaciei TaxID=186761 RepID=UPI003002931C
MSELLLLEDEQYIYRFVSFYELFQLHKEHLLKLSLLVVQEDKNEGVGATLRFAAPEWAGAAYLIWMVLTVLYSSRHQHSSAQAGANEVIEFTSLGCAFANGLLCNLLTPKSSRKSFQHDSARAGSLNPRLQCSPY